FQAKHAKKVVLLHDSIPSLRSPTPLGCRLAFGREESCIFSDRKSRHFAVLYCPSQSCSESVALTLSTDRAIVLPTWDCSFRSFSSRFASLILRSEERRVGRVSTFW